MQTFLLLADTTSDLAKYWPFLVLVMSVAFIIVAIAYFKAHAFIALVGAALLAGLLTAKPEWSVLQKDGKFKPMSGLVGAVEMTSKGLGDTARDIAISIAFAAVIGLCLMESGAADRVVRTFLRVFGQKNAGWALLWATYILSIPIFFDTMFMLMAPLAGALSKRTGKDYVLFAMCVACGGVITHSMTIPHPGPMAMIDNLKVDSGLSLVAGLLCGVIPAIVGYFLCRWANSWLVITPKFGSSGVSIDYPEEKLPSFFWSIMPVLLPIVLIAMASLMQVISEGNASGSPLATSIVSAISQESFNSIRNVVDFVGHKNIALLIGAVISVVLLLRQSNLSFSELELRLTEPIATSGTIILITSAGGAFGLMLREAGLSDAIKAIAKDYSINLILLSWLVASMIRVAQGSATVAILSTSLMVKDMVTPELPFNSVYLFLAIGWGAMFGSWMNDSGFWVYSRIGGFTQKQTLATWTIMLCCLSTTGLLITYLGSILLPMAIK